jgi:ERCC4-type nuclease
MMDPAPTLPHLPGVRCPSTPADFRPVVVVDTREQTPLVLKRLPSIRGTLTSGDYAPAGLEHMATIERKSGADLVASVIRERERFERELHRLRGFPFARVLVTCSRAQIERGEYRSQASPRAVLASCTAFEVRYGVPFVFVPDEEEAAQLVESWLWYVCREVLQSANALVRGIESAEEPSRK